MLCCNIMSNTFSLLPMFVAAGRGRYLLQSIRKLSVSSPHLYCSCFILALWLVGSFCGVIAAKAQFTNFSLSIDTLLQTRLSVAGFVFVSVIPAASLFLTLKHRNHLLIGFFWIFRGFCYGFASCCYLICFGNPAWLLFVLTSFSNIFLNIPLFYLCLRRIDCDTQGFVSVCFSVAVIYLAISLLDFLCISPSILLLS